MTAPLIASLTLEALGTLPGKAEGLAPLRMGFVFTRVTEAASG